MVLHKFGSHEMNFHKGVKVMSEDKTQDVDTSSAEFKDGVEAGLNSKEDTKNWKAGNELGQELKKEDVKKEALDRASKASR